MDQTGIMCGMVDETVDKRMNLRFLGLCVSSTALWYFIKDQAR
jgi:hypothetical protein